MVEIKKIFCLLSYPMFTFIYLSCSLSMAYFFPSPGKALFLHAKTAIFYFAFDNYPVMYDTFCSQSKQRKRVFKDYCTTLDRAFIG